MAVSPAFGGRSALRSNPLLAHLARSLCGVGAFLFFFASVRFLPLADAVAVAFGGPFIVTPGNQEELITLEKVFLVDLEPDFRGAEIPLGTRAYVRVHHGSETLASQWYRQLRQVFLRQLNV